MILNWFDLFFSLLDVTVATQMSCFPFSATTFDRLRGKQHHNTTSSPAGGPDPPPRHVLPAAAASVPPESTAITRRLLSPPHPRSPLRVRRRQILSPPHLRQRDPAEEGGLLHRRRERAVGMGVQVLANGEGELRAALPLPGVLRPHLRRRPA